MASTLVGTSSLAAGRQLEGEAYQIPRYQGRDFRAKVLWRDGYTCQHCGNFGPPHCWLTPIELVRSLTADVQRFSKLGKVNKIYSEVSEKTES